MFLVFAVVDPSFPQYVISRWQGVEVHFCFWALFPDLESNPIYYFMCFHSLVFARHIIGSDGDYDVGKFGQLIFFWPWVLGMVFDLLLLPYLVHLA